MIHTFPAGDSDLDTMVETLYKVGGLVHGSGGGEIPTNPAFHTDEQSRVTQNVQTGIEVQGPSQIVRDFSLQGPGKTDASNAVGILMAAPTGATGLQQGRCLFSNLGFEEMPIAIQTGRTQSSSWADTSKFQMLVAGSCGTVVLQQNTQGAVNSYEHVHASNCSRVFDLQGGGNLHAFDCSVTSATGGSTFLRIGDGTYVGHQKGQVVLENVKFDSQVEDNGVMVEMTDDASVDIIINGGHHAAAGDGDLVNPLFFLMPNGNIHINGFRGLFPGCIHLQGDPDGNPVNIVLTFAAAMESIEFDIRELVTADSEAKGIITVRSVHQHRSGRQEFRGRYQSRVGAW